jgi:hypothetical protein
MTQQDIDLQKIQVLENSYQGWFNFRSSIIAGGIIGTLILVATMQYEKILNIYAFAVGYLIIVFSSLIFIRDMKQSHNKHIGFINDLIQKIEKGEKFESIEELNQKWEDINKNVKSKIRNGKNLNTDERHKNKRLEMAENKADSKTIEEKIDSLINGREKERILSRLDGLFNLSITLSTFIVGIFVSQREFIATNVIISFPLIGVVFTMVFSFVIGTVKGVFGKSMKYRMLAYCLLLFLPLWFVAIPILVALSSYVTTLELQTWTLVATIILSLLTISLSKFFVQSFERKFPSLFEQEINTWKKIIGWIAVLSFFIVLLSFITTLLVFLAWGLPILLNH